MEILKGPLGSHRNYLTNIALENCIDYFGEVKKQEEQGSTSTTPNQYKRLRLFLNAIESLNNVPEYYFHEFKEEKSWANNQLRNILGQIRDKTSILRDVEQITNAYKHCQRHNQSHLSAGDLQNTSIHIGLANGKVNTEIEFDSIEDGAFWGMHLSFG